MCLVPPDDVPQCPEPETARRRRSGLMRIRQKPTDASLGRRVCAAHARQQDWPHVRSVAAALYKSTKDVGILRRFAAAALVEATATPPPPTKLLTLKLGDKMLERCIDESGGYQRCSAEDVELLASLREARGDFL